MTSRTIVHPTAESLAAAAAARLITTLVDIQATGRIPGVALTGGGVGTATLAAVAASPANTAVDFERVDFYWGDERFVDAASDERNAKQAQQALFDVIGLDSPRIHRIAARDGRFGDDVDAAAADYAALLAQRDAPLDVVLLGMGAEGHVASVFPHSAALDDERSVVAVRNCPKPPPTRVTLTPATIRTAREVWLLVAGRAKADAVARARGGADEQDVPAAGAIGAERTLWLVDRAAATELPGEVADPPM